MSRVFFSSLGMFVTEGINSDTFDTEKYGSGNRYVANLTMLRDLEYKDGLENLACQVFFDSDANVTMIENYNGTVYRPRDRHWNWAKQKARSAVFIVASVEHLLYYHLFWGNIPGKC